MVTKKKSPPLKNAASDHPPVAARKATRAPARRKRPAGAVPAEPEAFAPRVEVSDEEIRVRAYYLHLEHHGSGRSDIEFWLLAERELRLVKLSRG